MRNTAFNLAKITAQGLLVAVAGMLKERTGSFATAWAITFGAAAAICFCLAMYHRFVLPQPIADRPRVRRESAAAVPGANHFFGEFLATFVSFFAKPGIVTTLCFLLLYRFGEAQLLKMVQPFLIGARGEGGLGLTNAEFGFVYGTIGVIALVGGGLLGGFLISRHGLKFWLWPMVLAMHLPDAVFVYLAHARPESLRLIGACVAVEQFGYGFGFAAYMLYMIYIARGEHATAHYAICTGFMALGMMLPGMWSGWLQEHLGYRHFFVWVLLATIPGFIVTALVPLDREFGKKS